MSNKMYSLTQQEIQEFISGVGIKESYKMKGHQWAVLKGGGKQYCKSCGLVALNNKFTDWCIDKGCNHTDHPQFQSTMKRLTRDNRL